MPAPSHPRPRHPHPRRWAALLFISIAQLMVFLDSAVMNIALPSAQQALHFSDGGRQWVITAYGLAFGGLLIVGGRLGDLLGRKRTFTIGLVGFALASALGGAAANLGTLLVARAGQGVFGALLAPAALALISLTFTDAKERAKAFGIYGAIATAGGVLGLLLGGVLTEYLNWRWSMFVNIPFAVIGIIGALTVVHDVPSAEKRSRIDVPGAVLATLGLVALVFGFSEAESRGWGSGLTVTMLLAGVVLLLAFLITQSRITSPLLPLHVLTGRNRAGAYLSVAFGVMSMFGMFLFLSYYLQLVKGYSPIAAGLAFVPLGVAQGFGSMVLGTRLSARMRPGLLMTAGYLVSAVGVLLLALLDADSSYALLAVAEIITGLGIGTAFMPAMSLGTHGVAPGTRASPPPWSAPRSRSAARSAPPCSTPSPPAPPPPTSPPTDTVATAERRPMPRWSTDSARPSGGPPDSCSWPPCSPSSRSTPPPGPQRDPCHGGSPGNTGTRPLTSGTEEPAKPAAPCPANTHPRHPVTYACHAGQRKETPCPTACSPRSSSSPEAPPAWARPSRSAPRPRGRPCSSEPATRNAARPPPRRSPGKEVRPCSSRRT